MSTPNSYAEHWTLGSCSPTGLLAIAYEAAALGRWPLFFEALREHLSHEGPTLVWRGFGIPYYVSLSVPAPELTTLNPAHVFTNKGLSRQSFAMAYLAGELIEDWERRRYMLANAGGRGAAPLSGVEVFTAEDRPLEVEDRVLFRALLPHLFRSMALYVDVASLRRDRDALSACLDALSDAIFVLDRRGTVLHANPAADQLLGETITKQEGQLRVGEAHEDARFRRGLRQATHSSSDKLQVQRLGSGEMLWLEGIGPDCVIVLVGRGLDPRPISPELLVDALGFTPAESRVASLLAAGRSLPEIADGLGLSVHTVRHHVKHLQAKTGTHRQAELLGKILDAVPRWLGTSV